MRAIGYKEFIPYIKNQSSLKECVDLVKQHSRNYAKRQLTFLRSMKDIIFVDVENIENAVNKLTKEVQEFLN